MRAQDPIERWEEFGQQLEKSIEVYLETCTILGMSTITNPTIRNDLVSRIDHRLSSFSSLLSQPLASARLSLIQTRENLVSQSPVHRLPHEILFKIFHLAIYSIDAKEPSQLSYEYTVRTIYQRLHSFAGVCSKWRRVGLEPVFWTLVPVVEHPSGRYMPTAAQLVLQRANNRYQRLRLAAYLKDDRPDIEKFMETMFAHYGPRFDSINLYSDSTDLLYRTINAFMGSISAERFSIQKLSLCHSAPLHWNPLNRPSVATSQFFSAGSPQRAQFVRLMESLRTLHICGIVLPFEGLSLWRLTEIRLQGVRLEFNLDFSAFIRVLASSPQLRTLEIISVSCGVWSSEEELLRSLPISLPNLQHLYMEDLPEYLFRLAVSSIAPGSHRVTINWTDSCSRSLSTHGALPLFTSDIKLSDFKVDVLILMGRQNDPLTPTPVIPLALKTLPTITTLYLDSFHIDSETLNQLVSSADTHEEELNESLTNPQSFPKLKTLHISRSHCNDPKVIRNLPKLVAGHPLEELGIGISNDCSCFPGSSPGQDDLDSEMEVVWESLGSSVSRLRRLPSKASELSNTAFENNIWQLW